MDREIKRYGVTTSWTICLIVALILMGSCAAIAEDAPVRDRYWELGVGCYFGGLGELTELDVARFDWVMVCFGNISSDPNTTELLNRLLKINPNLKFMVRLWPGLYVDHPPGQNHKATFMDYLYVPGVKERYHEEVSRQIHVILDHIDKPENVIGFTMEEEEPYYLGGIAFTGKRNGQPIDGVSPALARFRKEIEAERGKELVWDDETRLWWGQRWVQVLGELHKTMKTESDGRLVFYWLQANHTTRDMYTEGSTLDQSGLIPHYWAEVIKPGFCDGFFAYPNNEQIWQQQYVRFARKHNWLMFSQASHPATMRLSSWDECVKLAKMRLPQNLGYFLFCGGLCAAGDCARAWNVDPGIPPGPEWNTKDYSTKLHVRRHLAIENVGMDIVRAQPALKLDVDLPLEDAEAGGYIQVRAVVQNLRESSYFLDPDDAVLRNVKITLRTPDGFAHHQSGTTGAGVTLSIPSLLPGERRVAGWWVAVRDDFDGKPAEPFVITADADDVAATIVRTNEDVAVPLGQPHPAKSGTEWIESGFRLTQRELTPRIVIEPLRNGVKNPAVGNDSNTVRYEGTLDRSQRLVLDAVGGSRLFFLPLVDHATDFGSFDSGYVVGSVSVNRRVNSTVSLRLTLTGKAEDGAESQLLLRYRVRNGKTTDEAALVNRFSNEVQTVTEQITPPAEAVSLQSIYLYRRNSKGRITYGPLKVERGDGSADGIDVSDRVHGGFPFVGEDRLDVFRYTDDLPPWTGDRVTVQLLLPAKQP